MSLLEAQQSRKFADHNWVLFVFGLFYCLSAARFAGMATTRLHLNYFNSIISKYEVELSVKRHRHWHICKDIS